MNIKNRKTLHLFGAKSTTLFVAQKLVTLGFAIRLITVSPATARRSDIADYVDLSSRIDLFEDIYTVDNYSLKNESIKSYFQGGLFEIGLCIGWQRIIPDEILKSFRIGIFGMHGSSRDLPFGRGRSPMNWSIIEGRSFFHTNLFKYLPGVDDGPIVASSTFSIHDSDDARTLHLKNMIAMVWLFGDNYDNLASGRVSLTAQRDESPTYYPKRTPDDGHIDWRDSYSNILRLSKAAAPPFRGVFSYLQGVLININSLCLFYTDLENHPYRKRRYAEICEVLLDNEFLVRCDGGVLIARCSTEDHSKLLVGLCFDNGLPASARFPRNEYGYFDKG